jgi:membrane fusion protein (multidrug efflux system)
MLSRAEPFRKWNPALSCALLLCGLMGVLPGCGEKKETPKTGASAPAPSVVVVPVLEKSVPLFLDLLARVEARETVELRARVAGFLEKQLFQEGREVKKDQVLYIIDRKPYEAKRASALAQLAMARAQVEQAGARLDKARKDVARLTPLAREQAVPQQDLDTALAQEVMARADVSQAEASVEKARADVVQAELDLGYCTITAPFDGIIGRSLVNPGNLVGRSESTLLNTVSLVDPIWVSFSIPEADYLRFARRGRQDRSSLAPDMELILADDSVHPHKGRSVMADRSLDIRTGTFSVVAEFPNPDGLLRPNQFARIRFPAERIENALLVPRRAVMEQQSAKVVYVVTPENKAALRTVVLGDTYQNLVIVKKGLVKGERVIVEGLLKVRPGMTVLPTDKPLTDEPEAG